ncbi:NADH-quinone oxidoreductase domain protein [Mycobacterium ulcerans str. Harvey]|uniref:NADH-quinone oxidoreductase domain protein n=1 Tax=Mycobacterium ulcerans str. Harvey TaxID=1299332 RepID=A0ABN0RA47_MYCUL|nr:NADH-quinone oxidoreductase domain protein [Mycobacterium ulcerans str. Harvey]
MRSARRRWGSRPDRMGAPEPVGGPGQRTNGQICTVLLEK